MKYFAYGSNMSHGQMKKRCPCAQFLGKAALENYRVVFDGKSSNWPGFSCANIVLSRGDIVWGGLYEITENELKFLDQYEHYPKNYDRKKVEIIWEGFSCKALVYIRDPKEEGEPSPEYVELLVKGGGDCGLSETYLDNLKKILTKV